MIKKILVPVDGSECSMRAAEFAAELVSLSPASGAVIYAVDRMPLRFLEMDIHWVASDFNEKARHIGEVFAEVREKNLQKAASAFADRGLDVVYDHDFGNPAEKIADYARRYDFDLIVMGTRGLSAVQELFLGSVSHKVLQLAPCPVVLVK